jgi:signal transduction histidine kinase
MNPSGERAGGRGGKARLARARLARTLLPAAAALGFAGLFPIAVTALAPDYVSRNVGYLLLVELVFASLCLLGLGLAQLRRSCEAEAAASDPLGAALPRPRSASDEAWRALLVAARRAAARESAERESRGAGELDEFLSSVHAIKTPATALSLMAERAQRDGRLDTAELRLEIDELGRAIDRSLARLRLLDFEKGSRMSRFDAATLARESVRRHRRLFIARSVSARIEGSFEADSDPDWLSFILDQLVSNAAKHASSSVLVELSVDRSGPALLGVFEVSDDGPGFGPEDASRAFGRSAAGSGRAAASGPSPSGYGLYLAREAALRLGARVELAAGEGARLRLTLPLSPGPFGDLTPM